MHALRDQGPIRTLNSTQVETYRVGALGLIRGGPKSTAPAAQPSSRGRGMGFHFEHGRPGLEARGGAREHMGLQGEHHRSRPGRLALSVLRSVLSTRTKPRLSALRMPVGKEFALQTVALCGAGAGRALTVRYHCGLLSQIVVGLSRQIDNCWHVSVINRARVCPAKS